MTVCEKCGAEREYIDAACPACQFHPKTVRELATATMLSNQFEAGEESFGTASHELEALAREIRAGKHPLLNEEELLRHERTVEAFIQVKPVHIYWTLFRLFLPAVLILATLWGVLAVLRFISR